MIKLKLVFFLCSSLLLNLSCKNKNGKIGITNIEIEEIMKEKPIYYLSYQNNHNLEITLNDLVVEKSLEGRKTKAVNLNSLLIPKLKNKVRIKIKNSQNNKMIRKEDLKECKFGIVKSTLNNDSIISTIDLQNFEKTVLLMRELNFKAELPEYCDNLEKSEDLSKWDEKVLEEEVIKRFKELRYLLNSGEGSEMLKEVEQATKAIFIAEYMNEKEQQEYNKNITSFFASHKDTMFPIENYTIRLMGNGKAVSLEFATGKYQGQGILSSEDIEDNTLNLNYFILHKPQNSERLEVFRYNSSYTTINQ